MLLWKCCAALPDESRLAIVIDEDMETDSSENSRDSDMDMSLSASPSPAPSTSVINNKLSASNHLTNHNHNNAVLGSSVVSSNGETDSVDVYNNVLAGGAFRGNSRPGSSSNNNRNNKESWNFNCRLRVKICKEVKKPGRGEWQTGCVGDCLVIDKLLVWGGGGGGDYLVIHKLQNIGRKLKKKRNAERKSNVFCIFCPHSSWGDCAAD